MVIGLNTVGLGKRSVPHFGATIRFVRKDTFNNVVTQGREKGKPLPLLGFWLWDKRDTFQYIPGRYQGTTNMSCCLGGGLANGQIAAISHLLPSYDYVDRFDQDIAPQCEPRIRRFKKHSKRATKPKSGVFIGGYDLNHTGTEAFRLFSKFKGLFDKHRWPVSYFIGVNQENAAGNVFYQPHEDTWYVCDDGGPPLTSMDDVKKRFTYVGVASTDTVAFEAASKV